MNEVKYCCRCGAKVGVFGTCSIDPTHITDPCMDDDTFNEDEDENDG